MLTSSGALLTTAPGQCLLAWGKPSATHRFYFPDFFLSSPWTSFEQEKKLTLDALQTLCKGPEQKVTWNPPLPFSKGFRSAQKRIAEGKLQKAVPYTFCHSETKMTPDLFKHILRSLIKNTNAYLYGFWNEKEGMLGATPELLFHLEGTSLTTAAVAGTSTTEEHLKSCKKEQKEHALVVQDIKQSLAHFGSVTTHMQEIRPFGSLFHLVTPIKMALQQPLSFSTLVSALHPTAALGAYPKEEGAKWLWDYQTIMPRKRFGAPVGYCRGNTATAYVAIRNIQWDENGLAIGAGCGVVAESQEEREWKEVQLKIAATKQLMGL